MWVAYCRTGGCRWVSQPQGDENAVRVLGDQHEAYYPGHRTSTREQKQPADDPESIEAAV